ncbi:hypothetical protein [Streptomyces sp. NPDC006193]|uniref:hypothetical protein n=1 Tax=Streptomyces sp. NPDC006193 TaxID=3155717 RepID=UPI0033A632A2
MTAPEDSAAHPAAGPAADAAERRRLDQESKDERQVWYFLAYFLFGIHILAFVMIYAVRHAG